MRRSACPSQVQSCSKRAKFVCPVKPNANSTHTVPNGPPTAGSSPRAAPAGTLVSVHSGTRSTLDVLKLLEQVDANEEPAEVDEPDLYSAPPAPVGDENKLPDRPTDTVYFKTVWCKCSARKHKKWEGDAILVVGPKTAVLRDMDRKEIGRSVDGRRKQLSELTEGSRMVLGGKEVEIIGIVDRRDYESGVCFEGGQTASQEDISENKLQSDVIAPKKIAFVPPGGGRNVNTLPRRYTSVPKFDPTAPGALVMPRPPTTPDDSASGRPPVVDVVVDPILCRRLRPHQRDGVLFLYECVMGMRGVAGGGRGAILADDMGVGKTLQCVALVWTLLRQGPLGGTPVLRRVLVVTPSSLTGAWLKEFHLWLGKERLAVCLADSTAKLEFYCKAPQQPVLITSYELLTRNHEAVSAVPFDLLICDEGHKMKNGASKTTTLLAAMPVRRRVLLTGTPVQNDLGELFVLADFCCPGSLGTPAEFRRDYEEQIVRGRQASAEPRERRRSEERAAVLTRIIGRFVLRRTQDVNRRYLPPKHEHVVFCRPTDLQVALYRRLLLSMRENLVEEGGDARRRHRRDGNCHLRCIIVLKKLCNHPALVHQDALAADTLSPDVYDDNDAVPPSLFDGLSQLFPVGFTAATYEPQHSGKLRVLDGLLAAFHPAGGRPDKAVVVSAFTRTLDLLESLCRSRGYGAARLDGSTPHAGRQELLDRFNAADGRDSVFLLSLKAGGVGLNLSGASRIVLFDVDWNPANDLQALSRVWRDGQRRRTHVYRLVTTGTVEERVYQRQMVKHGIGRAVIDAKDNNSSHFSAEELRDLYTLDESTRCTTHDMLECGCDGDGSNVVAPRDGPTTPDDVAGEQKERACQLSVPRPCSAAASKALSMDELLSWQHVDAEHIDERHEDSRLIHVRDFVSFVFSNSSETSPD